MKKAFQQANPLRPLRIGIVCHSTQGGSSRAALLLADRLAVRKHNVFLFGLHNFLWEIHPKIQTNLTDPETLEPSTPIYWDWTIEDRKTFQRLLIEFLRKKPLDILHFHYAQPFAQIIKDTLDKIQNPVPLVIGTFHGTDLTRCVGNHQERFQLAEVMSSTTAWTTVSNHMLQLARQNFPEINDKIEIIPNFTIMNETFRWRTVQKKQIVLLHASNFRPVKNTLAVAKLFLQLRREIDVAIWFAGDGPDMPKVKKLLQKSSAAKSVRYFGFYRSIDPFLDKATFLISASHEESFGLTILEAMARGVPAIASAVGGVPELIEDGHNGILFSLQKPQVAVDKVLALLNMPENYQRMSKAAIKLAQRFSDEKVVDQYEAFYARLLENKHQHGT